MARGLASDETFHSRLFERRWFLGGVLSLTDRSRKEDLTTQTRVYEESGQRWFGQSKRALFSDYTD